MIEADDEFKPRKLRSCVKTQQTVGVGYVNKQPSLINNGLRYPTYYTLLSIAESEMRVLRIGFCLLPLTISKGESQDLISAGFISFMWWFFQIF